ncbi:MAG: hypothetical protein IPP83_04580 [Flavobacteriales bacterium]|nr:hypothetical protein [Flavobacteriales bacterium]
MQSALDSHPLFVKQRFPVLVGALLSVALSVQSQTSFVLVIDTLITPSDGFNVTIQSRSGCPNHFQFPVDTSDRATIYYPEWNITPNVVLHFPKDSCVGALELDLDDDGGRFVIRWKGELPPDIIRIPRFQVLERCQRDTIKRTTAFYNVTDTVSALEEVRTDQSLGSKAPNRKCHQQSLVTVNGAKYVVPLRSVRSDETVVINFHGYDPSGCNELEQGSRRRAKPCRYFHGSEKWERWCYFGELLLE